MRRRPIFVAGCLAILLTVVLLVTDRDNRTAAAARPAAHRCAAAAARCDGTIQVPLNWGDPASPQITVGFAWVPRTDRSRPAASTILVAPGGPAEALSALPSVQAALGPVLRDHNLLMVDPRGFGGSSPLRCPGLDIRKAETIRGCAASLNGRLQFFTTDQATADLNAVRQALEVPALTLFGNSYDTLLAQAFAARYPQHTRAVFLDSVIATRPDGYATQASLGTPYREGVDLHADVCRRSRACREAVGAPTKRLAALLEVLRDQPDREVTISQLLRLSEIIDDPVIGRESSAAMVAYRRGDPAPLRRLLRHGVLAPPEPGVEDEIATSDHWPGWLTYQCADFAFPFDRDGDAWQRRQQLQQAYAQQPFWPYTAEEVAANNLIGLGATTLCVDWPTPRPSPPVPPQATFPAVPALVVGGELDTTTPASQAAAVAQRFPLATFISIPFGSHATALLGEPAYGQVGRCVQTVMRSFLAHPHHPVQPSDCTAETYRALGTFPRTTAEVPPARGSGLDATDQRLTAAAFATATDALARLDHATQPADTPTDVSGVRGGRIRLDHDARSADLERVRLVTDLAVTGHISVDGDDQVTASLRAASDDGGNITLHLRWTGFRAQDATPVRGTLDGRPFQVRIPST